MDIENEYYRGLNFYKNKSSFFHIMKEQFSFAGKGFIITFLFSIIILIMSFIFILSENPSTFLFMFFIIISISLLKIFTIKTRQEYRKKYELNENEILDLQFHPIYKSFFDDKKEGDKESKTGYINDLIEYSDVLIERKSNGFFYNPIVILLISFISAIIVNMMTSSDYIGVSAGSLIITAIYIGIALFAYYMITNSFNLDKDYHFKKFLIKLKYRINKE